MIVRSRNRRIPRTGDVTRPARRRTIGTMNTVISTTAARVVPPGAGLVARTSHPAFPDIEVKFTGDGIGFSMIDYAVPARFAPPPNLHRHTRENAVIYVLEGELHYWFEHDDAVAVPGTAVLLPAGAWFRWANETDRPARLLALFAPGGFEQYFVDLFAAIEADGADDAAIGRHIGPMRERYGDEAYPH
jgi:mannose-6-phosphate isomerase-like protein (cupin superfamily)